MLNALAQIKNWRGSLRGLRWWAAQRMVPRRVVRARGLSFTLQCDNWVTHFRWATYNRKEPETLDWIDSWGGKAETFFDIGSNIGVYTIYAALRHPGLRVIAFEPEYANLHLLRDNILENGLKEQVDVYAIALGNCAGLSHLHLQDLTPGSALHTESREALDVTRAYTPVVWKEGIYVLPLDEFCQESGIQPNYIKIDVDGTEPEVLEGSIKTLSSDQFRSILVEMPNEKRAKDTSQRLLTLTGLHCQWRDPLAKSPNEIWVRDF